MSIGIAGLLVFNFVVSVAGLCVLLWSMQRRYMSWGAAGARVIFQRGEEGRYESRNVLYDGTVSEPTTAADQVDETTVAQRIAMDTSARRPAVYFLFSGVLWLLAGSVFGLLVSLKFTFPDWLTSQPYLTFGRLRMMHLNAVIYGWTAMGGLAAMLWLLPRLLGAELRGGSVAMVGGHLWNLAMLVGLGLLAAGVTDGLEWLEFHWSVDLIFVVAGALVAAPLFATLRHRSVPHLYVSLWYLAAALVWFPALFLIANAPMLHFGVEHAAVNWWFAHNVLGLFLTPIGLALAYYLIPKVLGKPIYSYSLSLIGFWSLALFYSQAGIHHLIGGPVPTWLVTLSIVQSVMMVIPVVAVAINHHVTMIGHFRAFWWSPTLRFVVTGALMYTAVSLVGSTQAIRTVNRLTHFTHFTVAHAHHGVYAFYSMVLFGAVYFMMPRLLQREWPFPRLIAAHYWLSLGGVLVYVVGLSIGGILQGIAMLDATRPFIESVRVTIPYLHVRSLGGTLMTLAHMVFAVHLVAISRAWGPERAGVPWQRRTAGRGPELQPAEVRS